MKIRESCAARCKGYLEDGFKGGLRSVPAVILQQASEVGTHTSAHPATRLHIVLKVYSGKNYFLQTMCIVYTL